MRILFVQPSLQPPGGGNGVAVWMLQSLLERGEVTVLNWIAPRWEEVDAYYGTSLRHAANLRSITISPWIPRVLQWLRVPHELFKLHSLMREARRRQREYDLVCSASNEFDLGCRGIQYVHFPWSHHPRPDCDQVWYRNPLLRLVLYTYYFVCTRLSGFSDRGMLRNLTLVNSAWTGRKFQQVYGQHAYVVLYPPALGEFPPLSQRPRRNAFLSIGRVHSSKEWEKLIAIVAGLRARGHELELTLAGSRDCERYRETVLQAMAGRPWVRLVENLSRDELVRLATEHRFGIHGMTEEHYGMAVAELVLAGCLTFAPADGGQVEILRDPQLLYHSVEDAVDKIDRVLREPELEARLSAQLRALRPQLGVERFTREFAAVVDQFAGATLTGART